MGKTFQLTGLMVSLSFLQADTVGFNKLRLSVFLQLYRHGKVPGRTEIASDHIEGTPRLTSQCQRTACRG